MPPHRERSEQRAEGTRLWLAPHSQCRRYWLCGVAIITEAIVCRRYTIMVAQIHHLKPRHKTPPQNPTTNHYPRPYHYRVPPARYCVGWVFVTPHSRYLRHRLCGANHNRVSPTRCSFHSSPHRPTARHRHNPHHKHTSLLPLTSYPLPLTSYLLPLTPPNTKKGRHPVAPPHILTSIAKLSYFTITFAAVPAVRTM